MFSAKVLIFRVISPQRSMKMKSFSLSKTSPCRRKLVLILMDAEGHVLLKLLGATELQMWRGPARLSSQPALLGTSATGDFPLEATLLMASSAHLCAHGSPQFLASRPPGSFCSLPTWMGMGPCSSEYCCDPARQVSPGSSGPESVVCCSGWGGGLNIKWRRWRGSCLGYKISQP